jgi:hypothetical protein
MEVLFTYTNLACKLRGATFLHCQVVSRFESFIPSLEVDLTSEHWRHCVEFETSRTWILGKAFDHHQMGPNLWNGSENVVRWLSTTTKGDEDVDQ